jgi:ABC-type transport system involved in multi-copper enzyme maturation permease subunit
MPIHDQSYRHFEGEKAPPGRAWLVIAKAGVMMMIRKRLFLGLLVMSWFQFIGRAAQIYFTVNFPQVAMFAPTAETFREFLRQQDIFVFIMTIYVGAGLIANDRRANALQIYLSKPLGRAEYIAGKAAVLFFFLMLITWVPGILLLMVQVLFAGSFTFLKANLFLFPAITVASLLQVLLATFTMLALSSLSKSSRFVGVMFAGLIFFTAALFNALRGITGSSRFAWMSPTASLEQLGDVIFRLQPRYQISPGLAGLTVVVLIAVSIWILMRRVRGVEIVT